MSTTEFGPGAWVRRHCQRIDILLSQLITTAGYSDWRASDPVFDEAMHSAIHALKALREFADMLGPKWTGTLPPNADTVRADALAKYPITRKETQMKTDDSSLMVADVQYLDNAFTYHPPQADQPARYVALRDMGRELAREIILRSKSSRERSLALTKLEEAIMWANAGIARNG